MEKFVTGNKKNVLVVFVIDILFASIFTTGCMSDYMEQLDEYYNEYYGETETETETIVLNERQKKILRKKGLPTDYYELNPYYMLEITRCEEMLEYLDKKYNSTFVYVDYSTGNLGETLDAYDENDPNKGLITVETVEGDEFKDDYDSVKLGYEIEDEITSYFDEHLGKDRTKVYCSCAIFDEKAEEEFEKCSSDNCIFINGEGKDYDEIEQSVKEFCDWIMAKNRKYESGFNFFIQNEEQFSMTTRENYGDMTGEQGYEQRLMARAKVDEKEIEISRR